ncbi:site-specific integrase [Desulfurobacterium sp.]
MLGNNRLGNFKKYLEKEGYSQNSITTYMRAVEKFYLFLKFYGFDEKKFDEDKLVSFLSSTYKTSGSLKTALSGIRKYLSFAFGIKFSVSVDVEDDFKDFLLIEDDKLREFYERAVKSRKKDTKVALVMMFYLGLKPSEIARLGKFTIKYIDRVPAIDEGKIKRLLIDREVVEILKEVENDGVVTLFVNSNSLKVTFFKITGKSFSLNDFKENYAYRLIRKGLPVDIVVEFSGLSLDRVSYLYRFFTLKSKQDIISEKLTDF